MLPAWSHARLASLLGLDRDGDYVEAEREEPACLLAIEMGEPPDDVDADGLLAAFTDARWTGRASQLSEDHVQWTAIDEVAAATRWAGKAGGPGEAGKAGNTLPALPAPPALPALILQRRSAVAFDGHTSISADAFLRMLQRTLPDEGAPWDALWWPPAIHLLLFIHRVDGLAPGLYLLPRDEAAWPRIRGAMGREFQDEPWDGWPVLRCLGRGDCRALSRRVSCDQDIAADGCFSLGMLADFDATLRTDPSMYRHLFWESGVVGQMLYLAAEAAGVRGTGIGCFYDDPVHDVLGLEGQAFQSLYHFTIGGAVEDRRLTVEPGYAWEQP
jgi:hypothetical protein